MKAIDIRDQVRLSLAKCAELVMSGLRYRLFRAAVTVVIIALAVAFLMNMLGDSIIGRRVGSVIDQRVAPRRTFLFWLSRISTPLVGPELTSLLAGTSPGPPSWREIAAWGELNPAGMQTLASAASREVTYGACFAGLGPGELRPLVGAARGQEIFAALQDPERLERFRRELPNATRQPPGGGEAVERFCQGLWREAQPLRRRVLAGHAEAVRALAPMLEAGGGAKAVLARGEEAFRQVLGRHGFRIDAAAFAQVAEQAALARDADKLAALAPLRPVKVAFEQRTGTPVKEVDLDKLLAEAAGTSGAKWLVGQVQALRKLHDAAAEPGAQAEKSAEELAAERAALAAVEGFDLSPDRVKAVASHVRRQRRLAEVENLVQQSAGAERGLLGFPIRTLWLIVVSFLVCIVGIANAMLMSVTERFREIATMKCLGATDGFIMINFILESVMQGVAGGVIGAMLGFLLGTARAWIRYGQIAVSSFPFLDLAAALGISFGAGTVISALAAVYPAWVAARLAPMEAMRVE
jgi:putative ABC transport system permease protein